MSPIQGIGVFAKEKITCGETVAVLGGIIVPRTDIKEYQESMNQVGIQIDDDFFIVPETRAELEKFGAFNHSCAPNLGFGSSITVIAIRDIALGDECVSDYAFYETAYEGFTCYCASVECRKTIRPDDWKRKDLQEKFGDYFSPYLRTKIGR